MVRVLITLVPLIVSPRPGRAMMTDRASDRRASDRVMSRQVAYDATYGRACETSRVRARHESESER